MVRQRTFTQWWAYRVVGNDQPLECLGDFGSKLAGNCYRFLPPNARCKGPLSNGQHEDMDCTARISEIGLVLDVPDEILYRLVVGHSTLTLEIGQKAMGAWHGTPFRVLVPSGAVLANVARVHALAEFPELPAVAWRVQKNITTPPWQSVLVRWNMTNELSRVLQRNEQTHDVPLMVCAFLRGYEKVPV